MRVTVRRAVTHRCPFVDEIDVGTIEASWSGDAVELHGFAHWLDAMAADKMSHEDYTYGVAEYLKTQGGIGVAVATRWRTAGLDVEVTA